MNKERIEMSGEQAKRISSMLKREGVSQIAIDKIINGDYEIYNTQCDLDVDSEGLNKYGDVLEKLSDGYTIDEWLIQGISELKIQEFKKMLEEENLTVDNAKAIYQYSLEVI